MCTSKVNDVVYGEKVGFVSEFSDQIEFVCNLLFDFFGWVVRPAVLHAFDSELVQVVSLRKIAWDKFTWVRVVKFIQREGAAPCEIHALAQKLRRVDFLQQRKRS